MKLSNLLKKVTPIRLQGVEAENLNSVPEISTIEYRADKVRPGSMFVAVPGQVTDGHHYIDEALSRGASAIVTQKHINRDTIVVEVENTRKALALLSAEFYNRPSEKLSIIGITGTNGKTTTTYLIEKILLEKGIKVGVIGTVNYRYSGKTFKAPMTTPESADLQKILYEMVKDGITHVVLEISSHAIDLFRICGCWIDVGVFTNLSRDHLDYHGDMQSYWECKKKLFTEYLPSGPKKNRATAVINCNNDKGKELAGAVKNLLLLTTGSSNGSMIKAGSVKFDLSGISGSIFTPETNFEFTSPLVGQYNLENILNATGACRALDIPVEIIKAGIESFSIVPGRLERIENNKNRFVFVDYAHTPDALEKVLSTLKNVSAGRIICVFGCGGDRDKGKRPQMGEIGGTFSDLVVATSDNPRTENPAEIITQIRDGIKKVSGREYIPSGLKNGFTEKGYVVEQDRRLAIQLGIQCSRQGDIILIAGKGHEPYQIVGVQTLPFDDRIEAEIALEILDD